MLRRPPARGRWSSQQQKVLLACAVFLVPWIQLADAQQQPQQPDFHHHQHQISTHQHQHTPDAADPNTNLLVTGDDDRDDREPGTDWPTAVPVPVPVADVHAHTKRPQPRVAQAQAQAQPSIVRRRPPHPPQAHAHAHAHESQKPRGDRGDIPRDASALATLAPVQSVRAPHPSRHLRATSSASGLTSPQIARSLKDWEVEDFVLLATVDGDLYASDRLSGRQRWHLETDLPMVETIHHRTNSSVLDDDYLPVDHYIWAVEPNTDGGLYVWSPESDVGVVRAGFSMKRLVEDLAPYADDEPPVVYTGDKKTTMVTLDAATGSVLKWFGSGGSQVNEAEAGSCLRPTALHGQESEECSSGGIITLGRTEYTVGIQRRDGLPIATLKYSEWVPNNFDNDLFQQHHTSLDSRYITSQHDGKVFAFDDPQTNAAALSYNTLSAPVARVFDVCRPLDTPSGQKPNLIVLPQPPMPSRDESIAHMRSNSIFLNQTEEGSWYALSGRAYPLIIQAPVAQISKPDWWTMKPSLESLNPTKLSKALVGTHYLDPLWGKPVAQMPTLPSNAAVVEEAPKEEPKEDLTRGGSGTPLLIEPTKSVEPSIIDKVRALPQSAANSVIDFVSNPILIILFVFSLFYNEKKLRRSYHRLRIKSTVKDTYPFFHFVPDPTLEEVDDSSHGISTSIETTTSTSTDKVEGVSKVVDDEGESSSKLSSRSSSTLELIKESDDQEAKAVDAAQNNAGQDLSPEKKKKAHRGRRGGVKHRKGRAKDASSSPDDDAARTRVEEAVSNAKKLGDKPSFEPDIMTIHNDMQAVTGSIISMGNIEVNTDMELGMGSNGTVVFAGTFDGREVAVKRMTIQFYDIATRETKLLRESDDHPNVIRYYSQIMRGDFLYIALERCACSLADVIEKPHHFRDLANAGQRDLPGVLYQITNGISHLHSLRIVHRDLKPQNILVNMDKEGRPRLLVSDFGLCKKLEGGQSSFGATTGRAAGTSGWRAPELLVDDDGRDRGGMIDDSTHSGSGTILVGDSSTIANGRRATRAIDIFSLGLVFFYVLTNGSHPFDCGDRYMREVNIRKGTYNLSPLDALGDFAFEAKDVIASMLKPDPKTRPVAREVMSHPFFWPAKKRLAFLCDVSDHFEKEPRDPPSLALAELESYAWDVTKGDFLRLLPREFVDSLGKQRKYSGARLLDLLRALRNKRNHYEDMPDSLKRAVGPLPDGYLSFWAVRFPMLLLTCWNVVYNVRWENTDRFKEYYEPAGL